MPEFRDSVSIVKLDTAPGPYYVTAKDGGVWWQLAGPFATHREAIDLVDRVRDLAHKTEPRSVFYAFGTARIIDTKANPPKIGPANAPLGITPTWTPKEAA